MSISLFKSIGVDVNNLGAVVEVSVPFLIPGGSCGWGDVSVCVCVCVWVGRVANLCTEKSMAVKRLHAFLYVSTV